MDSDRPSLFEFAGGTSAWQELAAAHHERCLAHPVLNHPFSHPGHPRHVERLGNYWAEVLGGPPLYSEDEDADQSRMLAIHAGNGGHSDLGEGFLECFLAALDDAGLPDDAEFRAALGAYVEWAISRVDEYAPVGLVVPAGQPMPRWSWDGLQPG
jgi:hemoglobin